MDPEHQLNPEAGAYRMVQVIFRDLEAAARILERIETMAPDPERALYLEALGSAMTALRTAVPPERAPDI